MEVVCPMTGTQCRHCSDEIERRVQRVGVIKTGLLERRETIIRKGEFCNNDGRSFVADLPICSIPDALKVQMVPLEDDPLPWMRMRGG